MAEASPKQSPWAKENLRAWLSGRLGSLRFAILLKALIIFLLLSPFEQDGRGFIVILLSMLVALATIYVASKHRLALVVGTILAVIWVTLAWLGYILSSHSIDIAADIAFVLLSFFALAVAVEATFLNNAKTVDLPTIFGGVAIYLVLGITWAMSFRVIEAFVPGSFSFTDTHAEPAWPELLYYSYTTLTTLGYGDILPIHPFARIWATLEAVVGVLYVAILVARLVALYRSQD